jgi:uncharacterized protein YceH (UPF0502 family)
MGRPPKYGKPMSGSERQRRYLDRLLHPVARAKTRIAKQLEKDIDSKSGDELARAKARIAQLEKDIAELKRQMKKHKAR